MAIDGVCGIPTYCGMCEAMGRPLFSVPDARRLNDRAPRAVCRFCYLRLVGIAPRQRERVDVAARRPRSTQAIADSASDT